MATPKPYFHAWCECGHHENWHFGGGGPCAYQRHDLNRTVGCDCGKLQLAHVEVEP